MNISKTSTTNEGEEDVVFIVDDDNEDFLSSFLAPKEDKA